MRGSRFVYALGLLALGGAVVAQADIKYRVNGGSIVTPSFNNDRAVVNLGAITADAVVHVFDDATSSTTGPSDSLDGIELRADMSGAPGNLKIRLIVGNEDLETDFRPDVTANMAPGVIDFGVEATEAIVYVDTDTSDPDPTKLRDAVILALAVSGNVEGDLSVGRVWRVQASSTSSGNGFIRGNVLASAKDDLEFMPFPADPETRELGEYAINVVTAARGIQGLSGPMKRIESEVGSDSTGGGIARVLVTGASGVVGLQAHVISGKDITAIFTAGPIGETGRVNIYAQRQIEQIRTVTSGGEIVLEAKADVVLRTGVNRFGDLISAYDRQGSPMLQEFTGNPSEDAPLGLIEVGGNLEGFIYLVNLAPVPGLPARKAGILVHGVLDAKVQIFYNLDYSKIIAEQILGFVTIGLRMTGVIAEFDREIHSTTSHSGGSLFIGNLNGFEMPEPYAEFTSGMTGIDCTPVEMDVAKWWFETDDCEGGTFDSLIRVGIFGSINIDRVTLETTPGEHRKYMPRIEFQEVPSLTIGSMEAGVVWSGDLYEQEGLAADPQSFDPTDPEDHYAKVTTVVIGCVSPTADLWLATSPISTSCATCSAKSTFQNCPTSSVRSFCRRTRSSASASASATSWTTASISTTSRSGSAGAAQPRSS
ncbi:MAG: hypothetical protein KF768_09475 [Phycisphaeraceae bacterium]|nr:hypothetical protein [Phycisphaeraceae bacterium]